MRITSRRYKPSFPTATAYAFGGLTYHFKPYAIFVMGFICGGLDHPIKWMSVAMLIGASLLIEWWRYTSRAVDYGHINMRGGR